jgi:lysophospholipase L1-like esterase
VRPRSLRSPQRFFQQDLQIKLSKIHLRAGWLVAGAAFLVGTGFTAWRVREAARLLRDSEPFQTQPSGATAGLLIVGDSTAVGTGASGPDNSVAGLISRSHPGVRIVNRATDGAKYADFAVQLQLNDERFDTVLVLGGGNDVIRFTGKAALRASVDKVAALARERGAQVILMPPGNVGNAPFFWPPLSWWMTKRSQVLHDAVRDAARRTGATYVDLYKPKSEDPFALRAKELHASDGLHPSDSGYLLWVAELDRQAKLDTLLGI